MWNFKYTHYNSGPKFTVAIWIPLCYVQPHQLPVWAISPGAFGLFLSAQLPLLPGAQSPSVISLPSALWQLSFPFLLNLILLVDPVYLSWELLQRGEWYMGFETLVRMFTPTVEQLFGWVWESRLEIIFPQSFEGVVSPLSSSFQDCLEIQSLSNSWSVYVTWFFCSEALICPLSQYCDIWQWTGFCMASVELDVL